MGLRGRAFKPNPGCTAFYFRVSVGVRAFDIVIGSRRTLTDAANAARLLYPGALIHALRETDFDTDGLPRVNVREHRALAEA